MLVASFLSTLLGGGPFGAATATGGGAGIGVGFTAAFGAGPAGLAGALALPRFFGGATRLLRESASPLRTFLAGALAALFAGATRRALRPTLLSLGLGI